jgi:hypothetical protein
VQDVGDSMPPAPAWSTFLPLMQRAVELASQLSTSVYRSSTNNSSSNPLAAQSTSGNSNSSSNGRGPDAARGRGRPSTRKQQPPPSQQQQQQHHLQQDAPRASTSGTSSNGTGAQPPVTVQGIDASTRPAVPGSMLHNSMYRLLRMADYSVLRHGVTLSDCEPFAALAAWGIALSGAATAHVLSHVDPHQPSTTTQAIKILKDIAAGMAVLVDGQQQPIVLHPPGTPTVARARSQLPGLAAAAQAASSRAMAAMGLPARVHALSQQLALLEQRRVARGVKGGAVSTHQKSVADQLEAALTALYTYTSSSTASTASTAAAVPNTGGVGTATTGTREDAAAGGNASAGTGAAAATEAHTAGGSTAAQGPSPTRLPPLAERHALIAADAWHRLGDHLRALGDPVAAAAAYTHSLHAYEVFDRSTTDGYAEFNQGCDHHMFAAYWGDIREQGREKALALPGAIFLHR